MENLFDQQVNQPAVNVGQGGDEGQENNEEEEIETD